MGVKTIRQKARYLRKNSTDAERYLWRHLCRRQLNGRKFRRQQPIGSYIVDFVCYEKKLIIEVDGGHHMEQEKYDAEREAWLRTQGYKILRFWNNQVMQEIEGVMEVIRNSLG